MNLEVKSMRKLCMYCWVISLTVTTLSLIPSHSASAANDVTRDEPERISIFEFFRRMPLIILPQIDSASRENLIRAYDLEKKAVSAPSALGGKLNLLKANTSSLRLATSEISDVTIASLAHKGQSPLLIILESVSEPTPDSQISFFTSDWLPTDIRLVLQLPDAKDFTPRTIQEGYATQTITRLLSPLFLTAELSEDGSTLTFAAHLPASTDDLQLYASDIQVAESIRIRYHWNENTAQWVRKQ